MKFNIRGKNVEITPAIRSYIEEKIGKLDKYFENSDDITANVLSRIRGKDQIVEVTIPVRKIILRCEVSHKDLYAAIDLVTDKIERQIRKNKTRIHQRKIKDKNIDFNLEFENDIEEENRTIVKRKTLEMKPMSEEEAILQMNLLGHEFFIFYDDETNKNCVLYRRKDEDYGIIEIN
ncbi:MAG: ribosome-associated translation inhibitor RaiA [Bacilli bacterium]